MTEIVILGSEGRLQGDHHSNAADAEAPIALFFHPHPKHGGTMNNKVVFRIFKAFREVGYHCLRINFRGVGRSEGRYDEGVGEFTDATVALGWIRNMHMYASKCIVIGYSFGAWIALQLLMRRPEVTRFIAVAPPVGMYEFDFLAPCPHSGLIIHGSEDNLIELEHVYEFYKRIRDHRNITIDLHTIDGAGHFFEKPHEMDELTQVCREYAQDYKEAEDASELHQL